MFGINILYLLYASQFVSDCGCHFPIPLSMMISIYLGSLENRGLGMGAQIPSAWFPDFARTTTSFEICGSAASGHGSKE